ncbi:hypothetical protein PVAP13_3NG158704 [Panicum virgatum]|uniref:Uncharacterized protein n=1 Tax=Panicum virgatum TaxID=38727 RepID=A0A8T0UE23_PANVG|nr:hypothetical protein PVAP13_3NG158704 [Panicum virgatum]
MQSMVLGCNTHCPGQKRRRPAGLGTSEPIQVKKRRPAGLGSSKPIPACNKKKVVFCVDSSSSDEACASIAKKMHKGRSLEGTDQGTSHQKRANVF